MGLFSDIISSIGNAASDVFGGGGDNNQKKKQQQQNTPTPAPTPGPLRLPAVFQAAQQQQQNSPLRPVNFGPASGSNPLQPEQPQVLAAAPQPEQNQSFFGSLLHAVGTGAKDVGSAAAGTALAATRVGEGFVQGVISLPDLAVRADQFAIAKLLGTPEGLPVVNIVNKATSMANKPVNFLAQKTDQAAQAFGQPGADIYKPAQIVGNVATIAPAAAAVAGKIGEAGNITSKIADFAKAQSEIPTLSKVPGLGTALSHIPGLGAGKVADEETAGAGGDKTPVESGTKAPAEPANAPASDNNAPPEKIPNAPETGVKAPPGAPVTPTVADLTGTNTRPAADIQKAIEDAHNAGDNAKVAQLIETLPDEMKAPMRSALGVSEPPTVAEPVATAETPTAAPATAPGIVDQSLQDQLATKTGDSSQDLQNLQALHGHLLQNSRDFTPAEQNVQRVIDLANTHQQSNDSIARAIAARAKDGLTEAEQARITQAVQTGNPAGLSDKEASIYKSYKENIQAPAHDVRSKASPDYQQAENHFPQTRDVSVKDAAQGASRAKGVSGKIKTYDDLLNRQSVYSDASNVGKFTDAKGNALIGNASDLGLTSGKGDNVGKFVKGSKVYDYSRATDQELKGAGVKLKGSFDSAASYVRDNLNLKTRMDASDYLINHADELGLSKTPEAGKASVVSVKGSDGDVKDFYTDTQTAKSFNKSILSNFGVNKGGGILSKAFHGLSSTVAQSVVMNPFVHGINLATNAFIKGGAGALKGAFEPIDLAKSLRMSDSGVYFPSFGKNAVTTLSRLTHGASKLNEKSISAIDAHLRSGMFDSLTTGKNAVSDKQAAKVINDWLGGKRISGDSDAQLGIFWEYFVRQYANGGRVINDAAHGNVKPLVNAAIALAGIEGANKGLQKVTGNQGAYFHMPGLLGAGKDLYTSGKDLAAGQYRAAINPVLNHVNPVLATGAEQALGDNSFGVPFKNGASRLDNALSISPVSNAFNNNGHSLPEKALNTFGIYTPHVKGDEAAAPGTVPGNILNVNGAQSGSTVAFPKDFTGEQEANVANKLGNNYSTKSAAILGTQTQSQQQQYLNAVTALKPLGITNQSDIQAFAKLPSGTQQDYKMAAKQLITNGTAVSPSAIRTQLVKNGKVAEAANMNPTIDSSLPQTQKNVLETYNTLGSGNQKAWLQKNNDNPANYYDAVIAQKQARGELSTGPDGDTDMGTAFSGTGGTLYVKAAVAQTNKQNNVPQSLQDLYYHTTKTEYDKMSGTQKTELTNYANQLNSNGVIDKFGLATGTSGGGSSSTSAAALDRAAGLPYGTISESFVKPTADPGVKSVSARAFTQPTLAKYVPDAKANPFVRSISVSKGVK